ncbi:Variant surface glycoprotein [Trypanosoma congolense IL3000]|uniref:Variant surface glycoprotein n=1 Tax=Trypanosoma congolense (strain IL3000) TaxID=1068625 RepID=F9WGJ4_TRYCI|nr:Variant surface glycoprotein [Trypanosoma congolense IL3000]
MSFFKNVVAFLVMAVGSFVSGQVEVSKEDNIEPFSLLCRIYNVAKNPPINYVYLQEADKIVDEIDALNKSLLEEKRHNEEENSGNNSEASVKPIVTRETALAQLSLNQITQRAHKILEDIRKINVEKKIEEAKAEFHKVIFGENGNESELDQGALNGVNERADACGKPGGGTKGSHAGNNLVVDFFCLCVQRQDGQGAKQVCGFYVGSIYENGLLGWNESRPIGSSTMWASIKGGCGKYMQQHPKSTSEARHTLDQFLKHLKTGGVYSQIKCDPGPPSNCRKENDVIVVDSNREAGTLGTGLIVNNTTELTCSGKKGGWKKSDKNVHAGGICVYYGKENLEGNINWLQKFKSALCIVDVANNQSASIHRALQKLQMILHRAEEIYETAKVITEVKKPVGIPKALQNASGNLTVHNTTRISSYSYNTNFCFIPPWVLFL